jgi:hypothetical protein
MSNIDSTLSVTTYSNHNNEEVVGFFTVHLVCNNLEPDMAYDAVSFLLKNNMPTLAYIYRFEHKKKNIWYAYGVVPETCTLDELTTALGFNEPTRSLTRPSSKGNQFLEENKDTLTEIPIRWRRYSLTYRDEEDNIEYIYGYIMVQKEKLEHPPCIVSQMIQAETRNNSKVRFSGYSYNKVTAAWQYEFLVAHGHTMTVEEYKSTIVTPEELEDMEGNIPDRSFLHLVK